MTDPRNATLTESQLAILRLLDTRGPMTERQFGDDQMDDLRTLLGAGYVKAHGMTIHIQRSGIDAVRRSL